MLYQVQECFGIWKSYNLASSFSLSSTHSPLRIRQVCQAAHYRFSEQDQVILATGLADIAVATAEWLLAKKHENGSKL